MGKNTGMLALPVVDAVELFQWTEIEAYCSRVCTCIKRQLLGSSAERMLLADRVG